MESLGFIIIGKANPFRLECGAVICRYKPLFPILRCLRNRFYEFALKVKKVQPAVHFLKTG
ncbi:hypothetical protein D3C81_2141660 [compost metagenome]